MALSPQQSTPLAIEKMSLSDLSSNDIQQAKEEYKLCIEQKKSTPHVFATKFIRGILLQLSKLMPKEKRKIELSLIEAVLQPCGMVLDSANAADRESAFRNTEAQILLRLQFWASLGDVFVRYYRKQKLSRKKKRRHRDPSRLEECGDDPSRYLLSDICDLLSILAMRLPQSRPFSSFLRHCLDQCFYDGQPSNMLPKGLSQKIYKHFEIRDPEAPDTEEFVDFASKAPQQRQKRRDSSSTTSSGVGLEKSLQRGRNRSVERTKAHKNIVVTDSNAIPPRRKAKRTVVAPVVSLVAPLKRRNSLLADGVTQPSQFVGSHFNTTLSNMPSLFREVSAGRQPHASKAKRMSKPKKSLASQKGAKSKVTAVAGSDLQQMRGTTTKRKTSQCFHVSQGELTNKRLRLGPVGNGVGETPLLRSKQRPNRSTVLDIHDARQVVVEARTALRRRT